MPTTAPLAPTLPHVHQQPALEQLLLGDLRQLLDEPATAETSRWLLATLDRVLANRPRPTAVCGASGTLGLTTDGLPTDGPLAPWEEEVERYHHERSVLYSKLQRLRDRIAHRGAYALIANEVRCDLRDLLDVR